jgi:hypothetical protein
MASAKQLNLDSQDKLESITLMKILCWTFLRGLSETKVPIPASDRISVSSPTQSPTGSQSPRSRAFQYPIEHDYTHQQNRNPHGPQNLNPPLQQNPNHQIQTNTDRQQQRAFSLIVTS